MNGDRIASSAPGFTAAILGLIAPTVGFLALTFSPNQLVADALKKPEVVAVMDVYLQLTTIFVSGFVLLVSTLLHIGNGNLKGRFRYLCIAIACTTGAVWMWIFLMGGSAQIPFSLYARPVLPGVPSIPPVESWLTWVRVLLACLGLVLARAELGRDRTSTAVPAQAIGGTGSAEKESA